MIDRAGLPNDLFTQFGAEKIEFVDIPHGAFRPVATESELAMHRRAALLARDGLYARMWAMQAEQETEREIAD